MSERGEGQRSWQLSPYELNVSYGQPGAAGQGADWFGPLTPITPLAPPDVAGRQWDYPSGYNLSTLPRIYEPVSFQTLRGLAEGYDLLRLVIETRKDQVARLTWTISARDKKSSDPRAAALRAFFARPDGMHTFGDWLRLLLEELFVIDAPALYLSRDRGGRLAALLPIDGATIKPVIDDWGRTPQPYVENGAMAYPVAYQQILKGYPAVDYSVRDLIYRPRNISVNRAYGFSPVEQVITTRQYCAAPADVPARLFHARKHSRQSLIGVPESWTPDQIASYQKYWDAYFDGDLGRRRRAKFVPGGVAKTFIQTKEPDLKGPFDEWLARIVCFAFSISPQALTAADEPRHGRDAEGDRRRRGPRPGPRLGEGPDRLRHRAGIRRARSRIQLQRGRYGRSADARGDPFELHVERNHHHQRGARRARPRSAG